MSDHDNELQNAQINFERVLAEQVAKAERNGDESMVRWMKEIRACFHGLDEKVRESFDLQLKIRDEMRRAEEARGLQLICAKRRIMRLTAKGKRLVKTRDTMYARLKCLCMP